jgi:hypothetical protein
LRLRPIRAGPDLHLDLLSRGDLELQEQVDHGWVAVAVARLHPRVCACVPVCARARA